MSACISTQVEDILPQLPTSSISYRAVAEGLTRDGALPPDSPARGPAGAEGLGQEAPAGAAGWGQQERQASRLSGEAAAAAAAAPLPQEGEGNGAAAEGEAAVGTAEGGLRRPRPPRPRAVHLRTSTTLDELASAAPEP